MDSKVQRIIWTREAEATLIEAVREHPALWDPQNEKLCWKSLHISIAKKLNELYPNSGKFDGGTLKLKELS